MTRVALVAACALCCVSAGTARAGICAGSPLALQLVTGGDRPDLILAQRTIDREWSTPSDSSWQPPLVGGVSEPGAMLMSAVVPGTGQLYVGEKSGYLFALVEAAGWAGWWFLNQGADEDRDDAVVVAGTPQDSASGWSFDRWEDATHGDATTIRRIYEQDREAYYDVIDKDAAYAAGWVDNGTHTAFGDLRERSDQRLEDARKVQTALWVNHLVAAFDALRAARMRNLPLRRGLELKATGGWKNHGPEIKLALRGRF